MLQEGGPLPGPKSGFLSNTQKCIDWGDTFADKARDFIGKGHPSGKEGWAPKNWCSWTVVLEKTLESPLDCKEIQPVDPKGNQPWIFIGRTDAEAPIYWPRDAKSQFIRKDRDAGKDWRQEEKGMTEDEMVGWHHWFNGHEFEQAPGDGEGQGSLACCNPWGRKELDMPKRLSNNNPGGEL